MTPLVGITTDLHDGKYTVRDSYANAVADCGGIPVFLPCLPEHAGQLAAQCCGLILTGGDDPIMEHWGIPTHPRAKKINSIRQVFELALLDTVRDQPDYPVLGICLGMQMMTLHLGGELDQYLPETLSTAADHWDKKSHRISGLLGEGIVYSHHRQAITHPGKLEVAAIAHDGVIEAVRDANRAWYVGVQWHPERTADHCLGKGLFEKFMNCVKEQCAAVTR